MIKIRINGDSKSKSIYLNCTSRQTGHKDTDTCSRNNTNRTVR